MGLFPFKKSGALRASISLGSDGLRYLELADTTSGLRYVRSGWVPPQERALKQDMVGDAVALAASLERLRDSLGGMGPPVAVGLPSRDVLIRLVEMPPLSVDDAREALRWDFEKHFPFSVNDAAFDLAPLEMPGNGSGTEAEKATFLVAACRLGLSEMIVSAVEDLGIDVVALEPLNMAAFRAGLGPAIRYQSGFLQVHVGAETSEIMVGYHEKGILFRTVMSGYSGGHEALNALSREVAATRSFAKSRFRDLTVEEIVVTGLACDDDAFRDDLAGDGTVPVVSRPLKEVWAVACPPDKESLCEGWEPSLGLCMRERS